MRPVEETVQIMPALPPIFAHRLGSEYGPESSPAALRRSLECKVEGLECDVVLTADGEVIGLHDPQLAVATDLEGWAHERSAAEVLSARLRGARGEPSEERPMRLSELLDRTPDEMPIQLDVKAYADPGLARETAERACEIATAAGAAGRVEIMSFFTQACEAAVCRGLTARLVLWSDYAPEALAMWIAERGISGVSLEGFIVSRELMEPLRRATLGLSVGTVNSIAQARLLLPYGPEILVSDRPAELRAELERLCRERLRAVRP